jgi:prephenate dehydrogenase
LNIERLGIVGTGLIGASIGLAAKRAGAGRVVGYDFSPATGEAARDRGAVDELAADVAGFEDLDLVVVAVPVIALPAVVSQVLDGGRSTVTDVGSTKGTVVETAPDSSRFVGGHPVTGAETHGPENANAELFDGATWFLTPGAGTDPASHRRVHGFVTGLGARPVAIDAEAHDRLVAITSHLPHAVANALANQAGAGKVDGHDPLAAAGGSFRDMTRVAGANPRIWVDIFLDNRQALVDGLREHGRRLDELVRALERDDAGYLARWIGEAAGHRRRMLEAAYATVPEELYRVRVHVPDRPGVISGITQALGAEGINIEDFELHHLSAERGGTAIILVAGRDQAERAVSLLDAQGYGALATAAVEG